MGLKIIPGCETEIGPQHFSIIWQDAQAPYQLFVTNVSPNCPTGNQSILGLKLKIYNYCTMRKQHYRHEKLPTCFSTISPNKDELQFENL